MGTTLAPTIEQTLNVILSELATFFGTTTEAIMTNAPAWLTKYGWYTTLHSKLVGAIFAGLLLGGLLAALIMTISGVMQDSITKTAIKYSVFIFILTFVVSISIPIITCCVAPEIVGLEAILRLLSA